MTDAGWRLLDRELCRWAASGRPATLWLRDDDAIDATDDLERLLALTASGRVPLALAVVPVGATSALAARLAGIDAVSVLQHGYAHANHARHGAKKSEFADHRPLGRMTEEIVLGRATIVRLFGAMAAPVLAPPWNRIAAALPAALATCGLSGLSRFAPRQEALAAPGVVEANAHVDLIAWREGRRGKPADVVFGEIAAHLAARRTGAADPDEPTGVLTHHLAMDAAAWKALAAVLGRLTGDGRARWLPAPEIFAAISTR